MKSARFFERRVLFRKSGLALSILFACTTLTACQSPPIRSFAKVKDGMEKDQVLEAAGSGPTKSRRWQGKDQWTYEFKTPNEGTQVREIHFEGGRAVYVGDKMTPQITADEKDRLNEESNRIEEEKLAEVDLARDKALGIARTPRSPAARKESVPYRMDEQDRRLQESMYGTYDPEAEKSKRAPNFESID